MNGHAERRSLLTGAAALAGGFVLGGAARPQWTGRQFHNQPADSHLHPFLTDLWTEVARQTGGRLVVTVVPQNGGVAGSDPAALRMLQDGSLEFFALMGGILGQAVPAAEIQGLPFVFASHAQVHRANDGSLGAYIGRECAAKGVHRFQYGLMENGFRQIGMIARPIRTSGDLIDQRIRVPDGEMFRDFFTAVGARPVTVNIAGLYDALKDGRVDGQENPLVVTEFNRLYEVSRLQSMTDHMWSGFNLIANRSFFLGLPEDVQAVVERSVKRHVARQRAYTDALNTRLQTSLKAKGQSFNRADVSGLRDSLRDGFYDRWKRQLGSTGWGLLENEVGRIGLA